MRFPSAPCHLAYYFALWCHPHKPVDPLQFYLQGILCEDVKAPWKKGSVFKNTLPYIPSTDQTLFLCSGTWMAPKLLCFPIRFRNVTWESFRQYIFLQNEERALSQEADHGHDAFIWVFLSYSEVEKHVKAFLECVWTHELCPIGQSISVDWASTDHWDWLSVIGNVVTVPSSTGCRVAEVGSMINNQGWWLSTSVSLTFKSASPQQEN